MTLMIRNLTWAFIGNLIGSLFYGLLFSISITKFGNITDTPLIDKIIHVAEAKTVLYKEMGTEGMIVLFVNALLCNWMVTMGAVMAFTSKATSGKTAAMWIPIFIRSEEHTSELQSRGHLVWRLLLENKKKKEA